MLHKYMVSRWFFDYVERQEIPRELKDSMRTHERTQYFINNLYNQLLLANTKRIAQNRQRFSDKTLRDTVETMAEFFIDSVRLQERKRNQSLMETIRQQAIINYAKDLDNTANGKPSGKFEELELKFPNDRESQNE